MKRKLFTETDAFHLLHPTKNKSTDLSNLYDNSSQQVYWQCQKDIRHVWPQSIASKTKQGYDCPYCSGRRTLKEESFARVYPKIAAELHPTKNSHFDPCKYSPTSNKKVTWLCSEGHEWSTRVENRTRGKDTKCPTCRKIKNSFATKYPTLLNEWHHIKNNNLNPFELTAYSSELVWWQCKENLGHESWKRVIVTRTKNINKGCPECEKIKSKKVNTKKRQTNTPLPKLNEYSKRLCLEWHPTLNKDLQPSDFTAGSNKKVWWLCSVCKHKWDATIRNRTRNNRGCLVCPKPGRKHVAKKGRSILEQCPELIKQWHPKKNKGLSPENYSYGSAKKIWWQCQSNPEHEWCEAIVFRAKKPSSECKLCKKEENSLEKNFPEIATEWHPTKNGKLKPSEVSKASGLKIWWQCSVNPDHEWESQVRNRTTNNSKCKQCASEKLRHYRGNRDIVIDKKDVEIYHICNTALASLSLLADYSFDNNKRLIQPVYRMIYSSVITALESYLSDSFLNKVTGNSERVARVITTSDELKEKKYSVTDILDWHTNVESRVTKYLTDVIWHNIYKVRSLYKDVLNISFPKNTQSISKAVGIRHDLVHRNGKTKKGKLHILTEAEVIELISEVKKFVVRLQSQLVKI